MKSDEEPGRLAFFYFVFEIAFELILGNSFGNQKLVKTKFASIGFTRGGAECGKHMGSA